MAVSLFLVLAGAFGGWFIHKWANEVKFDQRLIDELKKWKGC